MAVLFLRLWMKSQGLTNQKLFPAPESCCKINVYFQTLSDKKAWRGARGGGGGEGIYNISPQNRSITSSFQVDEVFLWKQNIFSFVRTIPCRWKIANTLFHMVSLGLRHVMASDGNHVLLPYANLYFTRRLVVNGKLGRRVCGLTLPRQLEEWIGQQCGDF